MTGRDRWVVAGVALLVIAVSTLLFWPRPVVPAEVTGQAGAHRVRLEITTPIVGIRDLTLEVTGPVERLVVAPTMVEMGHASAPVTATPGGAGRFQASGVEFFMSGRWDLTVAVAGPDGVDEVVLPVLIAP